MYLECTSNLLFLAFFLESLHLPYVHCTGQGIRAHVALELHSFDVIFLTGPAPHECFGDVSMRSPCTVHVHMYTGHHHSVYCLYRVYTDASLHQEIMTSFSETQPACTYRHMASSSYSYLPIAVIVLADAHVHLRMTGLLLLVRRV